MDSCSLPFLLEKLQDLEDQVQLLRKVIEANVETLHVPIEALTLFVEAERIKAVPGWIVESEGND